MRRSADTIEWAMAQEEDRSLTYPYYGNPSLTGELRRRSMDLTRALAAMRDHKR